MNAAATTSVLGACPHDCPDNCSFVTSVRDGIALKVQGNPQHPQTDGVLCTKVSRYTERTYHPQRVLQPLRRVGPKGQGRFEPVTWDQALDDIADLLRAASPAFGPAIEALIVYNSNPVAVAPDSARVVQGFAREDLFTVVLEHFMTDTADYADYVLPATTQLEHWDIHLSYGHTDVLLNRPAIAPWGQARPNTRIFRELAQRMGFTDPCFAQDDESLCRMAYGDAVDFDALLAHGFASLKLPDAPFAKGGFPTPLGPLRILQPAAGGPGPGRIARPCAEP